MATNEFLTSLYKEELGRDADRAGFKFWKSSNLSDEQLRDSFNKSSEGVAYDATSAAPVAAPVSEPTPAAPATPTNIPTAIPKLAEVTPYATPTLPEFNLTKPESIAAPYVAPDPYVPDPTQTVAGQMDTLMDKNNPYLQQAGKAGERTAQARGLLNSSMSAQAAQGAAMDRALPIAQQDAAAFTAAGMAGYEGEINASLVNLQGQINSNLAYQESVSSDYINQRSLTLQGMISAGISAVEAEQQLKAIEYQSLLNTGLSDRQAQDKLDQIQTQAQNALFLDQKQQEGANFRAQLELDLKLTELDSNDQEAVSTAMTNFGLQYQKDISSIQLDTQTSGTEKTKKMLVAQNVYETNLSNTALLYNVPLTWTFAFDESTLSDAETAVAAAADAEAAEPKVDVLGNSILAGGP